MSDVTDLVCGMVFEEETAEELGASAVHHEGKRYWFCSPACARAFEAAPRSFLK